MKTIWHWLRGELVPWLRGRMFRTGVPLDREIVVTTRIFTAANGITALRLLALPAFVYLVLGRHSWLSAFLLLGVMTVLDSLDGYVARRFNQATRLGNALDPLTDRATVATACIALMIAGILPVLLVVLIVGRDLVLLAMVGVFSLRGKPLPVSRVPVTRLGKLATAALMTGIPLLLLTRTGLLPWSGVSYGALAMTGAGVLCYYASLAQYARAGIARNAGGMASASGDAHTTAPAAKQPPPARPS